MPLPLPADDAMIASILQRTAATVCPQPGDKRFLEVRLADALVQCLSETHFRPELVRSNKALANAELADWNPQPGRIDVAVTNSDNEPRFVFELKIEAVEWTLWDIFKLVSTTEIETVEAAYMVVAAKPNTWGSRRDCVELFDLAYDAEELEQVEWDSRFLFSHYKKAWQDLLGGGTGRPRRVPDSIVISPVGSWPLPAYPPYELRAVRVSRATASRDWLIFEGDWPTARSQHQQATGDRPRKIATDDLTVADLPATDAPEDAYHAFALSFDGYRELGSIKRSGRIANQSLERWRQTRQLPNTTTELRGCLFFEQRRWHHFGYGFDQETMEYLRAVIDKIRSLLTVE